MTISFAEATQTLLAGEPLAWSGFEDHAGGSLTLTSSGQRRLFAFLMGQDRAKVARGDESLFAGIAAAWNNQGADPASNATTETQASPTDVWRLDKIEASGFGGLTLCGGPSFELQTNARNWCLNGQNGSGKTSIVSAILWALTGQRIREQDGPITEHGERSPVISNTGHKIGTWPSFASYPAEEHQLSNSVEVWVRLTFVNQNGEAATAFRRMVCPTAGDSTTDAKIDPRLMTAPQLLETGLLMPARLVRIGFGDKSSSLYEAVKMLTGLDQLSDIADGSGQFTHRGRRFLKYGKDNGLDRWSGTFSEEMTKVVETAEALRFKLPDNRQLGNRTLVPALEHAAKNASDHAAAHLRALESDIAPGIDTSTIQGRETVRNAVAAARMIVNQGTKGILLFDAWTALKEASEDTSWTKLPDAIARARVRLNSALEWHTMQVADEKFRLKALAARYFVPPHRHSESSRCPLCEGLLSTKEQEALATELTRLQKDAEEAEGQLDDVCRRLEAELLEYLPAALKQHLDFLATMEPKKSYGNTARGRFCEQPPFTDVLLELSKQIRAKIKEQEALLPVFSFAEYEVDKKDDSEHVVRLRQTLHNLDRLLALVAWWDQHREAFRSAWAELIGIKLDGDEGPAFGIVARIQLLEEALSKATPADQLAKSLLGAATAAEKWAEIRKVQDLREEIAKALQPLKDLRLLVAAETARSIANLSSRIREIVERA